MYRMRFSTHDGDSRTIPIKANNPSVAESIAEELARKLSIRAYVLEYPAELTAAEIVGAMQ